MPSSGSGVGTPITFTGLGLSVPTDLDYLITYLRVHLKDMVTPYTYSDELLRLNLLAGLKLLMPRWNNRYIPSYNATTIRWDVTRNPSDIFSQIAPPVIQYGDERPIILAASISLKSGLIYSISSNAISWRDDEVSFSNITGAKMQEASLIRDYEELNKLVPERRQRLARSKKGELVGFRYPPNIYESESF